MITSEHSTNYNSIARDYDIHEKNAITLWHLGYWPLFKRLEPVKNKSILDYGCGSGTFCRFLYEHEAIVTGVDISENMISVAKDNYTDDISYHQITSGNLDFLPTESFDLIVSNFVLCTISTRLEVMKIMRSIHRVLKKDGSFSILNTNWDKSNGKGFISFRLHHCNNLYSGKSVTAVINTEPPIVLKDYFWSQADYIHLLTESGFAIQCEEEPLAIGYDMPWISENSNPPYYIVYAKK